MKNQVRERKENCCPLLERGENEAKSECIVLRIFSRFIQQLGKPSEWTKEDLQKMCGG